VGRYVTLNFAQSSPIITVLRYIASYCIAIRFRVFANHC